MEKVKAEDVGRSVGGNANLLGVVFVVLKLCHVIDWSWWWVTLPFWAFPAVYVICLVVVALLG